MNFALPLNAVIGFSEGLIERTDRHPLNEHQIDRLSKIKKSGEHLLTLINNVLDIAKVESGTIEIHTSRFDVPTMVSEMSALAEGLFRDNPTVKFETEIESDLPLITSDRDKIKQILINLIGNAVKFTQEGSVKLRVYQEGGYVRWSVEDTGVGIPDNELHKVFEKFHQVDQATHRSIKGTGLGLSLCKSFAETLGSALTVKSVYGQGSTFCLSIPPTYSESNERHREKIAQQLRKDCQRAIDGDAKGTVLCIEDDPLCMQLLVDYLEEDGFRVVPAFNGTEGLELAQTIQPDIITLDVMMPGLDGWEVLRRLKDHGATASIPVVLSSAIDEQNLAFSLGADDYVVKPIEHAKIRKSISRLSKLRDAPIAKVALCDDDPMVLEILSEVMTESGYTPTQFTSGRLLLESLEDLNPDAIVLDLMMPEMDGFAVVNALQDRAETQHIPVILMTAKSLSREDLEKLEGGIRAVVEKNGMSRDRSLAQLVKQIERLNIEEVQK